MSFDSKDRGFLKRAVDIAFEHMRSGEGRPFGAVLVLNGKPVAEGWNSVFASRDPTAHAELMAIRRACKVLGHGDLSGSVLYASGEPCPMCLGAMFLAGVSRCYYATTRQEASRIGAQTEAIYAEYLKENPEERAIPCIHAPMAEASAAFDEWLAKAD